ncbi:hypothetical protein AB0L85_13520 [Streptomyces sp. NPDC052051]|uniref:hypothetical protein n=1 Tax=Streptomyces sp. NPDC052051 TaxID=3154649 RepID=UPI003434E4F6
MKGLLAAEGGMRDAGFEPGCSGWSDPRMTDGSRLNHAYGSAQDIPTLLDRIAPEPKPELWSDLRPALCHQGSVYSAGFAVLPARITR